MSIKMFVSAILMFALVGVVFGDDEGESWDAAGPSLVMTANETSFTIKNVGTAPADIGGAVVMDENNTILATMSYNFVLDPNPFKLDGLWQTAPGRWQYSAKVNASPGMKLRLTNGVGTYAACVVA